MGKSIKLFRIMGIPFGLHPSWFLIFIFLTWSLANGNQLLAAENASGDEYGAAIACGRDLNRDGVPDVVVGPSTAAPTAPVTPR